MYSISESLNRGISRFAIASPDIPHVFKSCKRVQTNYIDKIVLTSAIYVSLLRKKGIWNWQPTWITGQWYWHLFFEKLKVPGPFDHQILLCTHTYTQIYTCTGMYVCIYRYINVHLFVLPVTIFVELCCTECDSKVFDRLLRMYVCIYSYVYVFIYVYMCIHLNTYDIYVHRYMFISVHVSSSTWAVLKEDTQT